MQKGVRLEMSERTPPINLSLDPGKKGGKNIGNKRSPFGMVGQEPKGEDVKKRVRAGAPGVGEKEKPENQTTTEEEILEGKNVPPGHERFYTGRVREAKPPAKG